LTMPSEQVAERLATALKFVGRLVVAAPPATATAAAVRRDGAEWRWQTLWTLAPIPALGVFWAANQCYPLVDRWAMVRDGFWYVLPVALLVTLWTRAQSSGPLNGGPAQSLPGLFLAVAAGIFGLAVFVNGTADTGRATTHDGRVIRTDVSSRLFHRAQYHVVVEAWLSGQRTETIEVTGAFVQRLGPSKKVVRIVTFPGRLGYEWIGWYGLPGD
jgi:hypothetical protein